MEKSMRINTLSALLLFFGITVATLANADDMHEQLKKHAAESIAKWIVAPQIHQAIIAQNKKHAQLSQDKIIELDKKWRLETKAADKPMIDSILNNPLSVYLKQIKNKSQGLYTEIFVMDAKGLNVGQSDITSDYWQGDEAKWQKTYKTGAKSIHIGKIEKDESTQQFQSQISLPIVDPNNNSVIGAITVGINIDQL